MFYFTTKAQSYTDSITTKPAKTAAIGGSTQGFAESPCVLQIVTICCLLCVYRFVLLSEDFVARSACG